MESARQAMKNGGLGAGEESGEESGSAGDATDGESISLGVTTRLQSAALEYRHEKI
jgi:hypothetical protein